MKFTVAFTVAAVTAPLIQAAAQASNTEAPSKWSLSIGIDSRQFDLRTRDPGVDATFIGVLSRSWTTRFEKLSIKAELMGGLDAPSGYRDRDGTLCGGCDINRSRRFASAGVGATFHLLRKSRFNPYLTAGTGIYNERAAARSPLDCHFGYCITGGRPYFIWQKNVTSIGLNGGVGVSFRLGGREFFVQQTAHAFDVRQGLVLFPLTLGIGF